MSPHIPTTCQPALLAEVLTWAPLPAAVKRCRCCFAELMSRPTPLSFSWKIMIPKFIFVEFFSNYNVAGIYPNLVSQFMFAVMFVKTRCTSSLDDLAGSADYGSLVRLEFFEFWLDNVLRATASCNFSTPQLPKEVRVYAGLILNFRGCSKVPTRAPSYSLGNLKTKRRNGTR